MKAQISSIASVASGKREGAHGKAMKHPLPNPQCGIHPSMISANSSAGISFNAFSSHGPIFLD